MTFMLIYHLREFDFDWFPLMVQVLSCVFFLLFKLLRCILGDATASDIDTAMKLGAGFPMGPLELADFTGLDTKKYILNIMLEKTGLPVFRPIDLLDRLVSEGKTGRKSGEGIYEYN